MKTNPDQSQPRPTGGKPSRWPWEDLKRKYLASTNGNLRGFARAEGIPWTTLKQRATGEGWLLLWREGQAKATRKAQESLVGERAATQEACNRDAVARADALIEHLDEHMRGTLHTASDLSRLAGAYLRAFDLKRRGLGMPRDVPPEGAAPPPLNIPTGLIIRVVPSPPPPPDDVWN